MYTTEGAKSFVTSRSLAAGAHLCHDGLVLHGVEGAGGVDHAAAGAQLVCGLQRNAQLQQVQAVAV